jgi:hypothetical protein
MLLKATLTFTFPLATLPPPDQQITEGYSPSPQTSNQTARALHFRMQCKFPCPDTSHQTVAQLSHVSAVIHVRAYALIAKSNVKLHIVGAPC